jgi:hypothetical protein
MYDEFVQQLSSLRRKRITLEALRLSWQTSYPDQAQHPERDGMLLKALQELEQSLKLKLPAKGSFEKLGRPPMPLFITLIVEAVERQQQAWSEVHWLPVLGFWPDLNESELITAKAINDWLIRRRGRYLMVPVRERSLEIFGNEKHLDLKVRKGALFSGRLPLSAIGAMLVDHPLPYRIAQAPGQPVLVVENHHTYWSLGEWNVLARRYAAVVYGAGNSFCNSGLALQEVIRETGACGAEYFGDLDPEGINIPLRFNRRHKVQLTPALDLYGFLLKHGGEKSPVHRVAADSLAAEVWLPGLAANIVKLWENDLWKPQEGLGTEQLFLDAAESQGGRAIRTDFGV